jgi:hypothetical protein
MLVDGWIDAHAHFYPPDDDSVRTARWEQMKAAEWQLAEPPRWDPDSTLAYMDRTGIAMQLLSNIPKTPEALRASNDYAATLVAEHPARFGLLAALPTDDCQAALSEVKRAERELRADGYAVTCRYGAIRETDCLTTAIRFSDHGILGGSSMRHVSLGGLDVSRLGLGAMGMSAYYTGARADDRESISTIRRAVDLGITLIDTAEVYGPYLNEELVGRAVAGRRDQVVLATKFGMILTFVAVTE